jgi:DNA-binding CsgD family transcriptional regulator
VLTPTTSAPGFLLLDSRLRPVAYNSEGLRILSFPAKPESIRHLPQFLSDKVRSTLVSGGSLDSPVFARECNSGHRIYSCRALRLDFDGTAHGKSSPVSFAVLLERHSSGEAALEVLARQFDLTARECETVALLLEGLTSKEIATRMNISPNTVKAFLRLVMLKMDVSTRSGIVGKAVRQSQLG